ncbi:hypothetical protein OEZ85_009016 [Tetradesmus obliquus]|uniref:Expansin-like EG45 domain-containing protein n=1 Tax=Tetradesmus obliquus TaxID=3088 RepID=A0ABY8TKW3_TETOB|nr:hypothetical protein OEZ85_009016 [Tetradesmus obliquus]
MSHWNKVMLLLLVLLASHAVPADGAADIRNILIENVADAAATALAAADCLAAPFAKEAMSTITCFQQLLPGAGGYPHAAVCQGSCAGVARDVTATCNNGSWVMVDGPCSAPQSGCYAPPWAYYTELTPRTSTSKLTPYGPYANSTVLLMACSGATDIDGDALTAVIVTNSAHGELQVRDAAAGWYDFVMNTDYNGPVAFMYIVVDPYNAASDVATATIR